MEIVQGVNNKQELINFGKILIQWDIKIYSITKTISYNAMNLLSNLADALIAATAIHHHNSLQT